MNSNDYVMIKTTRSYLSRQSSCRTFKHLTFFAWSEAVALFAGLTGGGSSENYYINICAVADLAWL